MKLFLLTVFIGLSTAAKLSNTYLPPNSAGSAGGHGGFLQGPQNQHRPSNQYIPPQTNFNTQGQPVQWSHGGWNSGQAGGSQGWQQGGGSGGGAPWSGSSNHLGSGSYQKPSGPVIPIVKFDSENDGNGNYHFEYATGNGIQAQEQGHINNPNTDWAENVVKGSYSYTGDDGKQYSIRYEADGMGFRPVGDHLPTPPPQPQEIQEVWDKVLAQQAQQQQQQQQGGWQQQQGGHQQGGWQQGGGGSGSSWQQASSSSWQQPQRPSHGGASQAGYPRPQPPQNQYLPPSSGGGYHY